jgi:hypothetical protein
MRRKLIAVTAATLIATGMALVAFVPSARTAGSSKFGLGYVQLPDGGVLTVTVFNPTGSDINVTLDIKDRTGFVASFPDTFAVPAGKHEGTGIPCDVAKCDGVPFITSPSAKVVLSADWIPLGTTTRQFANAGDWRKIS